MPSGSTRITMTFLYSFPSKGLKFSAIASDVDKTATIAKAIPQHFRRACFIVFFFPLTLTLRTKGALLYLLFTVHYLCDSVSCKIDNVLRKSSTESCLGSSTDFAVA